ncbi:MAG: tyrosine-type recombinase/integrase, partial [Ilumatobacter sp.]
MKGFMRQRGNSWELRVFLGRDPVTGKKRYATKTVRGGKREAQTTLAEMVTDAERGFTASTTATVGELLEAWFEFAAPDFSPKTVRETRGYIDRSLLPGLGSKSLAKLKPAQLDAFYRRLIESGGSGGRPLAPGTVRRIYGILRRALNQGVKWGWLGTNPALATTPPRVPVSDIKPPAPADLARVLRRASEDSPDLASYLMLAAATGARRSELVALRWADLDLEVATVSIERGIVQGPDGLV